MTKAERQNEIFEKIIKGMDKVYEKLIEYQKQKNSDRVVMIDGKIVRVKP